MINTDADLRNVYKRLSLSMTGGTMCPVPDNTSDRIEVFASPSGSTIVFCGRCNDNTYSGQPACCKFMIDMLTKYFGGRECTSLSCI